MPVPKGYTVKQQVTPPKGYSLPPIDNSVPLFIREGMDTSKVREQVEPASAKSTPDSVGTEKVAESTPGKIAVYDPKKYTPEVRDHEMTHQYQFSRSDGNVHLPEGYEIPIAGASSSSSPLKYEKGDLKNYDYGGETGLLTAQKSGKSMADFNQEQQADIVADYKAKQDAYLAKARAGKITKQDMHDMYRTYLAYHPLVQQLKDVPKSIKDTLPSFRALMGFGKPTPLAPAPAAPGLPDYSVAGLGVVPADQLLGGYSVPVKR